MEILKEQTTGNELRDMSKSFPTDAGEGGQIDESFAPPPEPQEGYSGIGRHINNPTKPRISGWSIITKDGIEYTASSCEVRIKGQFEKEWLRYNALQAVREIGEEFGPESSERALDKFIGERSEGKYNFGSEHCIKALMDYPGTVFYLFLILRRCHPKITEDEARKLLMTERTQCAAAIKWSLGNFLGSPPDGKASGMVSPLTEKTT